MTESIKSEQGKERITYLNNKLPKKGNYLLYWMQAACRCEDNPALDFALAEAKRWQVPLLVYFVLTPSFPEANHRHYAFLLEGIADVAKTCKNRGLPFILDRVDYPEAGEGPTGPGKTHSVPERVLAMAEDAEEVVTDMGYLAVQREWRKAVADNADCAVIQVETETVVPVTTASEKEEYAAATIRRKIHRQWERFLFPPADTDIEAPGKQKLPTLPLTHPVDPSAPIEEIFVELGKSPGPSSGGAAGGGAPGNFFSVPPSPDFRGGTEKAKKLLHLFIDKKLHRYAEEKNDPNKEALSTLSPYLHFGHISPVRIAREVCRSRGWKYETVNSERREGETSLGEFLAEDPFIEELVVRRELSFNFTYYNPRYNSYHGALPDWAKKTLDKHKGDPREYIYTTNEFENAETHDPYWNAAQLEMVITGKMHGYMRMYWGKKILEWSSSPEEAFETALYLNNKYELDGRDPNGFAGVAWCFGKHDRPWKEREIFGTVRYMNAKGLKRKFDADEYARKIEALKAQPKEPQ